MTAAEAKKLYEELNRDRVHPMMPIQDYIMESIACMVDVMAIAVEQATDRKRKDDKEIK